MRDLMTTLLDVLGLLLVAAGVGFAASYAVGPAGLAASGAVILGGSWLASWLPARRRRSGDS